VVVTDTLPGTLTFVGAIPTHGGPCTDAAATVTCDLGTLAAGAAATVYIHVTVNASTTRTVTNGAKVTSATPDPDLTNNSSMVTTAVDPDADLAIIKTASPDPVVAGDRVTYTLAVRNAGPADARAVAVTDHLPAGTTIVSVTPTSGTCAHAGATVTCSLGTVPALKSVNIEVVVQTSPSLVIGPLANTATVSSATHDPDLANNSSTATSRVTHSADVAIAKSFDTNPTVAGLGQRFVIAVTNKGPSDASDVVVSDPLSPVVALVSARPTQGSCTSTDRVTCSLGTLPAGEIATIELDVRLNPGVPAGTNLSNTATVTSTTPDHDLANNTATAADPVVALADISLTKTAPARFMAGADGSYAFRVSNAGPSVADGPLTITDHLPAGLTFVSARGTAWSCSIDTSRSEGEPVPHPLICTNPRQLGVGQSAPPLSVTVHVASDITGPIVNTATAESRSEDPHPENNTSRTRPVPVTPTTTPPTTIPPTTTPPTTTPPTTTPPTTTPSTTTTTVPPTTTTTKPAVPPVNIITGYGLWGPGGPTGAQFAMAGLALLAGGAGLVGLRLRRRKAVR
jgi:large repetitive protein